MCRSRIQRTAGCILRLFALALVVAWTPLGAAAVQTIALRGENPFGSGDDATFSTFSLPSLNNRGQVAFAAQLQGSAVSTGNDTGYWIASDGSFGTVVREGAPAPGMPAGTVFGNVSSLFTGYVPLNDAGEIAVGISVTQSSGLWIGDDQSLTLLAAQGSPAPGAEGGAAFGGLAGARATLNRRGDVAFNASLSGAPYTTINSANYHDGLWILNRSGPVATVLAGEEATPLGEGAQFIGFQTFTHPSLNRNGEAVFAVSHRLAPPSSANGNSLWVASSGGLELRGVSGQPAPEIGANATLGFHDPMGINAGGTVAVSGSFSNPGGTPSFGTAIIVSDSTGILLAARSGAPAPGTAGHVFRDTFYEPSLSSNGQIAFYGSEWDGADLNTGRSGVWAGRPDDLQLVVHQGDAAPDADATFGSFFRNTPSINRFGQLAFPAALIDSQSSASTGSLWATDLDGNLAMIARVGEGLEVAKGDVRTISNLTMLAKHGDDDGRPRSMNDLGQIAFSASFTDGTSGIFLSNAVAHLPGDYNGSGKVNAADYVVWRKAVVTQDLVADGDRDGVVGAGDYALLREFFGQTLDREPNGVGLAAAPEPGSALLLAMLSPLLLRRWRD